MHHHLSVTHTVTSGITSGFFSSQYFLVVRFYYIISSKTVCPYPFHNNFIKINVSLIFLLKYSFKFLTIFFTLNLFYLWIPSQSYKNTALFILFTLLKSDNDVLYPQKTYKLPTFISNHKFCQRSSISIYYYFMPNKLCFFLKVP